MVSKKSGKYDSVIQKRDVDGFTTPSKLLIGKHSAFTSPLSNINLSRNLLSIDKLPRKLEKTVETTATDTEKNRSARKKSVKTLIEQTVLGDISGDNEDYEDLAQHICNMGDENDEVDNLSGDLTTISSPESSPKYKRRKIAKSSWRVDTPAHDLPAHEIYFDANKTGHQKTSNNSLSSLKLLDYEEYFTRYRNLKGYYEDDLKNLEQIYLDKFNQWHFELCQNFNLCLYGFGSKKSLLMQFANYLYNQQECSEKAKIVIVNGYVRNLTIRDIFKIIASGITSEIITSSTSSDMLATILSLLDQDEKLDVTLILNSLDGPITRRLNNQNLLSRLCSHPQIHLIASTDHLLFPLLWDSSVSSMYNFLFYDCTTFQPYNSEVNVVDDVHEILGRGGRRMRGKEGVVFVLKSLPKNANKLFEVLIREQLKFMADKYRAFEDSKDNENRMLKNYGNQLGIEYRVLYQKSVEQFICSNEINFRTLLKEFSDHEIIHSKRDILGTELLFIPLRREELEAILEDITS